MRSLVWNRAIRLRDHPGDRGRCQLARRGQQPLGTGLLPFAGLVVLADHARADILPPVIKLFLELVLDDLALLLNDQDLLQPFGEMANTLGVKRPGHADFEDAQPDLRGQRLVDAQRVQRLPDVKIGLAGRNNAEARVGAVDHDAVQPVGPGISHRGVDLVALQSQFLRQGLVRPPDAEASRRDGEIFRQLRFDPEGVDLHGGGGLNRVRDRPHRDPAAGIARHCPAVQPEIQELLNPRRVQDRHHRRGEDMVALVRQGG